ncbi:MAG: Hpt domain-containing protein, partial [Pseudomonadales bacterium]|nr:Hpt domain-containing protein [Pseudomonadales bacterium]
MSGTQDFVALDWIRGEITQTLEQAQQALEAVAESPDDASSMRNCLTSIHQVHGTLKMVELSGPTQLAAEMEDLAQALMNKSVPDINNSQEVLMQSILQMQAYLDRIHREQQDRPGAIVPIVNDLRVARGEEPLPQAADDDTGARGVLALLSMTPESDVVTAFESNNGPALVPKLRQRYQRALVALLRRQEP